MTTSVKLVKPALVTTSIKLVKPALVTTSIKQLLVLCDLHFNFPSQYISYQVHRSVFSDHLSYHWGKADDHNCNYSHPKMADVESGKDLFGRLNCFYSVF